MMMSPGGMVFAKKAVAICWFLDLIALFHTVNHSALPLSDNQPKNVVGQFGKRLKLTCKLKSTNLNSLKKLSTKWSVCGLVEKSKCSVIASNGSIIGSSTEKEYLPDGYDPRKIFEIGDEQDLIVKKLTFSEAVIYSCGFIPAGVQHFFFVFVIDKNPECSIPNRTLHEGSTLEIMCTFTYNGAYGPKVTFSDLYDTKLQSKRTKLDKHTIQDRFTLPLTYKDHNNKITIKTRFPSPPSDAIWTLPPSQPGTFILAPPNWSHSWTTRLAVEYGPRSLRLHPNTTTYVNDLIQCKAEGYPVPDIYIEVSVNGTYYRRYNEVMFIVTTLHRGNLTVTCHAANTVNGQYLSATIVKTFNDVGDRPNKKSIYVVIGLAVGAIAVLVVNCLLACMLHKKRNPGIPLFMTTRKSVLKVFNAFSCCSQRTKKPLSEAKDSKFLINKKLFLKEKKARKPPTKAKRSKTTTENKKKSRKTSKHKSK